MPDVCAECGADIATSRWPNCCDGPTAQRVREVAQIIRTGYDARTRDSVPSGDRWETAARSVLVWVVERYVPRADARVVCLCGSTRFRAEFTEANRRMTMAGKIVVAPGVFAHDGDPLTDEEKTALNALHFRKIDLADEVFVVDPGGYVGDSTRREIAYARQVGKPIAFLTGGSDA